jgi:hypothetical protein
MLTIYNHLNDHFCKKNQQSTASLCPLLGRNSSLIVPSLKHSFVKSLIINDLINECFTVSIYKISNYFNMKSIFLLLVSCCVSVSLAAQSGNKCANAQLITPNTYTVDTMYLNGAAYSNFIPYPDRGRWYKAVPATDGLMTITSCGGGADTRLFLFTNRCDSLTIFGYADDECLYHPDSTGLYAASFAKPVKAGQTYFIHWDNAWDDNDFSFTYTLTAFTPRPTQHCTTASTVNIGITRVDSLFGYASKGIANKANWYKITPTRNGRMMISNCGADPDTRLWVYDSTCAALRSVISSDDDCLGSGQDSTASQVRFDVKANQTYYIEWDDAWDNAPFNFTTSFEAVSSTNDAALNQAIRMAPNPAKEQFTLFFDFEKTTNLSVNIVNIMGQTVMTQPLEPLLNGTQTFDISLLQTGVYMIRIQDGSKSTYKKLIKE